MRNNNQNNNNSNGIFCPIFAYLLGENSSNFGKQTKLRICQQRLYLDLRGGDDFFILVF
jgi:hypothetical protein